MRPREVGARRLRVRPRRRSRLGTITRLHRTVRSAGHEGSPRLHRMGGGPTVEQRQGRAARHQLLRDHAMVGGGDPAAAPDGDDPVGRRQRLLPRHVLPRRHALPGRRHVVPADDHHRAARPRRAELHQRRDGRARDRSRDAHRRGTRGEPVRLRGSGPGPSAARRLPPRAVRGLRAHHRPLPVGGELGRSGPAPARQRRGLRAGRLGTEVARDPRPGALDRVLHRLRRGSAEAVLRSLPEGRGQRMGHRASGEAARAHGRRRVHRSVRGCVADPANRVDHDASGPRRRGTPGRAAPAGERRRASRRWRTRASRC